MVNTKIVIGLTISALVLIIILSVAPMIGSTIDDVDITQDDTVATTTVTFGASSVVGETLNLSTETYTIAAAAGQWNVVDGTAAAVSANLTAEINTNSTLFTAVDGTGTVAVSTILKGTEMNAYTSTTNITGASVTAATFTGALDGSDWSPDTNTDLDTPAETWTVFVGLIILAFLAVIIGIVVRGFREVGGKDN